MTTSSLITFQSIRPELNHRQLEVIKAFRRLGGLCTMHEVALSMARPLNTISGRFTELEKKQMIVGCGTEKSPKSRPRTIYRLVEWPKLLDSDIRSASDIGDHQTSINLGECHRESPKGGIGTKGAESGGVA